MQQSFLVSLTYSGNHIDGHAAHTTGLRQQVEARDPQSRVVSLHKRLDRAVFAANGWNPNLSDEEILEKLLALNLERRSRSEN
jgi:hypothetical protein